MKNYIQKGDAITVAAPTGGVTSGSLTIVGALAGVAVADAAEGDAVTLATVGVYSLPKRLSASFASGAVVSWSVPDAWADVAGSGKYPIGVAIEDAGNGTTEVITRLDGIATAAA